MSGMQRVVHNIMGHTRTGIEMRLTAQIGEFEMDEVILDLGSEVFTERNSYGLGYHNKQT